MKSKFLILSLMLAGAASIASAQEDKERYDSESWKDNFFVSVGVGMQATANPDTKFGKSVSPLINVSVGKLINPVWGVRGQIYGWQAKQKTAYPFLTTDEVSRKENYVGLNADAMVNLTNLFLGYKPDRLFELNFFAGPSVNIVKNYGDWALTEHAVATPVQGGTEYRTEYTAAPVNHDLRWLVGASLGLGAKFNINKYWAIDVEARGQVTPAILGAYSSGKTDGYLHITAGATYTFGGKKFVPRGSSQAEKDAMNEEINRYREELAQAQTDLADTKNALETAQQVVPETKEVVKEIEVAGPRAFFFRIGSAQLTDQDKVNIQMAAKVMKANPEKKYRIAGYADKATGSAETNQRLTEQRAQAVYDALVAEGVSKDQLEVVANGGTDNMFGQDSLNRVVVMEKL